MGTFDQQLGAFTPTKFLGSPPENGSVCVTGFDQLAYVAGISSNIFNGLNLSVRPSAHSAAHMLRLTISWAGGCP